MSKLDEARHLRATRDRLTRELRDPALSREQRYEVVTQLDAVQDQLDAIADAQGEAGAAWRPRTAEAQMSLPHHLHEYQTQERDRGNSMMRFSCPACCEPWARTREPEADIHGGAIHHCASCGSEIIFEAYTREQYQALWKRRDG